MRPSGLTVDVSKSVLQVEKCRRTRRRSLRMETRLGSGGKNRFQFRFRMCTSPCSYESSDEEAASMEERADSWESLPASTYFTYVFPLFFLAFPPPLMRGLRIMPFSWLLHSLNALIRSFHDTFRLCAWLFLRLKVL